MYKLWIPLDYVWDVFYKLVMPANLPPVYYEIEKKLKYAQSPEEKIQIIMEMLAVMPKHKGTDKLQADLRRKIAILKKEAKKRPHIQRTDLYTVPREGAGQVVIIGPPNSGKSTILKTLTNAKPHIGDYPFTTNKPEVGMMQFENVWIQLVDTPPLCIEHKPPWLLALIRSSDSVLLTIPCDQNPITALKTQLEILEEGNIFLAKKGFTFPSEELMPKEGMIVLTRCQNPSEIKQRIDQIYPERFEIFHMEPEKDTPELRKKIFHYINRIRVYTKKPGKKPDLSEPVVLRRGSTIIDAAYEIHKDFAEKLRFARVWREGVYNGMMVGRDTLLEDGDVVEFHIVK